MLGRPEDIEGRTVSMVASQEGTGRSIVVSGLQKGKRRKVWYPWLQRWTPLPVWVMRGLPEAALVALVPVSSLSPWQLRTFLGIPGSEEMISLVTAPKGPGNRHSALWPQKYRVAQPSFLGAN